LPANPKSMDDANYVPAAFRRAAFSLHPSAKRRQPAQLQKKPRLCGVRELAPAFTRESPSRITETRARLAPLECGGLPPLSTPGRALPYQYPVGAQKHARLLRPASHRGAAPAAASPALSDPPHANEVQPLGLRKLAPAFAREAPSRIAQTPLFFRGSELQLRQKTAARSVFLSRCSSRELSLSRHSKLPQLALAPAFVATRSSRARILNYL
jgi:hypothetical protein